MKHKKKKNYKYLTLLVSLLFIALVYAVPTIIETIGYANNTITSNSSVIFEYNISDNGEGINNITWNWDGTPYLVYDPSLVLFYNFDNRSALGENDTEVKDLSMYGNNGTVIGATFNQTGGKQNGGYEFDGTNDWINISQNYITDTTKSFTISAWVNAKGQSLGTYANIVNVMQDGTNPALGSLSFQNKALTSLTCGTGNATTSTGTSGYTLSYNTWNYASCVIFSDGTSIYKVKLYVNGNLIETKEATINVTGYMTGGANVFRIGVQKTLDNRFFNGSIDEVSIDNKSLSDQEAKQKYNSFLIKEDSQNYSFQTNQSLNAILNSTITSYNFPYYLCSSNSTGSENCTASKIITQLIPTSVSTANFSNLIGTIGNVYCVDIHSAGNFMSNLSWIDTNNDGTLDTLSDYQWNRNALENAKINCLRDSVQFVYISPSEGNFNETYTFNNHGNINTKKNAVAYAKEHNIKILFTVEYPPTWLRDYTSGYCNSSGYGASTCPPNNYTKWGELVADFLEAVDCNPDVCEIEYLNEPNLELFYLNNITNRANPIISIEYNKGYNATYLAVKNLNSSYQVGGTAEYGRGNWVTNILFNWFGNFSNQIDFVSYHQYIPNSQDSFTDYYSALSDDYSWLYGNMTAYSVNTSRILIDELNIANATIRADFPNEWGMQMALAYIITVNSYPANASLYPFQWGSGKPDNTSNYAMVSEPLLNNTYYRSYNISKDFANVLPIGCNMKTSLSNNPNIKIATCNSTNYHGIVVVNKGTTPVNETIDLTGSGIANLKNYLTGTNISIINNIAYLGIMDSYQEGGSNNILYLTEDLQPPTITIQSPISQTYTTTNIDFNITLDEEGDTCIYSLNNFLTNYTMTKQGWVNEFKANNNSMSQGYHIVNFSCNDTSNNWNNTASVNFTIDTLSPNATLISPINSSTSNVLDQNFSFNVSDNVGLGNGTLYIYNQSGFFNSTFFQYISTTISTISSSIQHLAKGVYTFFFELFDFSGNKYTSGNYTFTLDLSSPNVNLVNPTTASGNYSVNNLYINITSSDESNYSLISNVGLKLWLRLNNETGENETFVKDYSYNSNGTAFNTTIVNGTFGNAFNFNGVNSYILMTNSTNHNISNSITISAWVKLNSFASYKRIVAKSPPTNAYPYTIYGLLTDTTVSGKNLVRMELASGGYQHIIKSTTNITNNNWYMVTGTYNTNTNETKLYINGVLDNSTLIKSYSNGTTVVVNSLYNGKIDTNNVPITIGDSYYRITPLNGSIDEVLIYNRALSLEEISAMYINSTHSIDKNLTNLLDESYNITAYAQDVFGQVNQTESRLITLDTTPPSVSLISPEHGTQDTDGSVRFIYSVSEENNLINCSLKYSNNLTYTTTSSSKGTNVLEVNIESGHQLYSENLKWFVSCTDNFNNIGYSSIFSLDTIPSLSGGGNGGTGGFTSNTSNELNPKYVNFNYPEIWTRNSKTKVIIQSYNQSNSIFYPNKVTFEHSINGLSLEETGKTNLNEYFAVFKVSNSAELGNKTIKVTIEDQRKIIYNLNFEISDGFVITTIDGENKILDETSRYILYILGGLLFLAFIVILIISLVSDSKRR